MHFAEPQQKFGHFQEHIQTCGDVVLKTFDELTVRLSLDSTNLQHRKLVFQLVEPKVPGFSYVSDEQAGEKMDVVEVKKEMKRKEPVESKGGKKKSKRK